METTVGKILLKHNVPADLIPYVENTNLDKKGLGNLFDQLVHKPSYVYRDTVTNLARLGFEVATRQGSSVGLSDLVSPIDKKKYFDEVEEKAKVIQAGSDSKSVKTHKIGQLYGDMANTMNKDILDAGLKKNQTLAKVILSGSRGSPTQYRQTVAAPVIVNDEKGQPLIEFPIKSSFAEGLSLPEYLAHSYGTRQGTVATKLAVADSGYFSKQLSRAAMTLRIEEHDCGTDRGVEMPASDRDSVGCYLAKPVGKYKKNNEVTPTMLSDLRNKNISDIIVRSPMTCEASQHDHPWSICQLCAGRRERGNFPMMGEYIGITAATALGEPLAQGQLNCLAENTLVRMADFSIKKIQDIEAGEWVLGSDTNGWTFPVKVTNKYNQGLKPTHRYYFRLGLTRQYITVDCTEIHPFLCNIKKWSCSGQKDNKILQVQPIGKKTKDFNLAFPVSYKYTCDKEEKRALLLGLLLGDGCYTEKIGCIGFSCADVSLVNELDDYFSTLGLKITHSHEYYYKIQILNRTDVSRNPAKEFLKELGIYGKYAHEKILPDVVNSWDDDSISKLIAGLFITDGSVYLRDVIYGGISFSSTSYRLVEQVKDLLAFRFAIYSSTITKTNKVGDGFRKHDQYQITITTPKELKKFNKNIQLLGIKKETLSSYNAIG